MKLNLQIPNCPNIYTPAQLLIWRLLKNPKSFTPIEWARESKIANKLVSKYPNLEFWKSLTLGFRLNSLAWFFTNDGKNKLHIEYEKQQLAIPPKTEYDLGDKIGEDKEIVKRRGIREMLDLDYD